MELDHRETPDLSELFKYLSSFKFDKIPWYQIQEGIREKLTEPYNSGTSQPDNLDAVYMKERIFVTKSGQEIYISTRAGDSWAHERYDPETTILPNPTSNSN